MIALFTDFGLNGPYVGQMKAVLLRAAPNVPVIDLFSDLTPFKPELAAYLLPAYSSEFLPGSVFVCIVDPGVGGPRRPLIQRSRERWFIGPDNGLLDIEAARDPHTKRWEITWRPDRLSASFHGRDLFAPVAARLARGETPGTIGARALDEPLPERLEDLPRVVYIDGFGNAITGTRAETVPATARLAVKGHEIARAGTFSEVAEGTPFWYENSIGLVEIAVNRGAADRALGISVGDEFEMRAPD